MTTLLSAANYRGAKTLVANFFGQPGKGIHFHAMGYGGGTLPEFAVTLGGTTVWGSGQLADVGQWSLDLDIICVTTGSPGSVRAIGRFLVQNNADDKVTWPDSGTLYTADIAITTTGTLALDFTGTNTAGSGYIYCCSARITEFD